MNRGFISAAALTLRNVPKPSKLVCRVMARTCSINRFHAKNHSWGGKGKSLFRNHIVA